MGECDRLGQGGGANGVSRFDGLIGGGASWCSRDVGVPETCVRCTITSQNDNIIIIDGDCLVIKNNNATSVTHLVNGK